MGEHFHNIASAGATYRLAISASTAEMSDDSDGGEFSLSAV